MTDESESSAARSPEADPGSDLALLRAARTGNLPAFEELVGRYQGRVLGLARRILGRQHDAEDVTQQTFLSVLEHMDGFREESSVSTWILRIAANHALKAIRKQRTQATVPLEGGDGNGDSYASMPHPEFIARWRDGPEHLAQQAEVRRLLDAALEEMDEKYRLVFVLRDVEELSTRETAEALGLSEANVKVRLLRARLMLRERLTRALGDEATRMFPSHEHE